MLDCLILGQGPTVILVHGTAGGRRDMWSHQLALADRHRLVLPDRRGYGNSPPAKVIDFAADGRDIANLLEAPAHLMGTSYGAIGSLLAAAARPRNILSLVVIEPPAFGVARGHPDVEALVARLEPVFAEAKNMTVEEHGRAFGAALGYQPGAGAGAVTDEQRERFDAARREKRPWEAQIPMAALREQPFPKLMFRGTWNPAFSHVAEVIAEGIGAELVTLPGGHAVQHTAGFNERVLALWSEVELAPL